MTEEIKNCPHGKSLEKIESHFINWMQWRQGEDTQNAAMISAPCDTCFLLEQVKFYRENLEKTQNRLIEANAFRTTMYSLEATPRLSLIAKNHLNTAIDGMSLDDIMQVIELHQEVMAIYTEGARRKASKIDIKASIQERKERKADEDKKTAEEILRKQSEKRKKEASAAAKSSMSKEEKAVEKIIENFMRTGMSREDALKIVNNSLKK